jgi:hypothetical protein
VPYFGLQSQSANEQKDVGVMKMKNLNTRSIGVLFSLLITIGLAVTATIAQQPSSTPSKAERLRVVVYDGDMTSLLRALAETYEVTIGFETVPQHPQPHLKFQVFEATRNDVFDAIVRAVPEYQWRESNGAIEFLPVAGASFLDTAIGTLQVTDATWTQATDALLNLPDVRASMMALALSRHQSMPESTAAGEKAITLHLTNATVREALNKFTVQSGMRFWVLRQSEGGFSLSN